ncbi:MAG: alpha/beta hydrolase [Acidobacteriaceae bacterium]
MSIMTSVRSADGTPLACWRAGAGPPLLLVHGGLCDHMAWYFVEPLLAQHFTVWSYDRRGHGRSGDTPPHSVAREVQDVIAVLSAIGEPAHLLGHSAGAILALEAAARIAGFAPPALLSLILYDPPFVVEGARERPDPRILAQMENLLAAGEADLALRIAIRETVDLSDPEIDAMQAGSGWDHLRACARAIPNDWKIWDERLLPDTLRSIRTRALLLMGSASPAWIRAGTQAVLAALPNATLVILEGQGHSAMIAAPALFAGEVAKFAARADPTPVSPGTSG